MTTILEAGCNDCYLLTKIHQYSPKSNLYGFDPIWINKRPDFSGINVYGSFVEDILDNLPDIAPSLIVSAHTFEHVVKLKDSMKTLINFAQKDARIIIEMPSLDTLLRLNRIDQIFHQHVQYITESSIRQLVRELDCSLNAITYNYNYWGGTVIFDFSKTPAQNADRIEIMYTQESILASNTNFINGIKQVTSSLPESSDVSLVGAAQMLPILYYHSNEYFNFTRILDDDPQRIGSFLPNIPLNIEALTDFKTTSSSTSSFVIGAVDSTRALLARSHQLGIPNVFTFFNSCI